MPRAIARTSYWYQGTSTTLVTIVSAAANTAGIVVSGASVIARGGHCRVMFKSSAPSAVTDTAAGTLAESVAYASPGSFQGGHAFPVYLPPGVGLYAQKGDADALSGFGVTYEVLV